MKPPPPQPGTDRVLLVVVGALAGASAAVWATGQLGARVWSGRWPAVPLSGAPLLLIRFAHHVADPALAWPAGARDVLPPAWLLNGALALALAFAASVCVTVLRAAHRPRRGLPARTAWARRADLRPLRIRHPSRGRLVFGYHPRRARRAALVAGEPRSSLVVLGPSQSGKTTGLAIPAILEWDGPVVATSVKTDLLRDTLAWRERLGTTWVYDPTASSGLAASCWSPLARCTEWQRARQVAAWLCTNARARGTTIAGDEDFWYGAAAKLLAPHLFAAATASRTMGDVVHWIDTGDEDEVGALVEASGVAEAAAAFTAVCAKDERVRSSVYATAEFVLEAFADPTVVASTRRHEIDPVTLLADGTASTLYVCAPGHQQERLRPVFATLLHEVLAAAYDKVSRTGRPLDPPLLIVLDEAANIAPLRDLDALASTAAGHGIQLVTVWQDLAQIQSRYGDRAATIVNNHRARIILSGISDPATLDYASRVIGEGDIGDLSVTMDAHGARSTTRARRERRLLTDAELRRLRPQEGVLVYGHLQPARLRLRPWYADRRLRARAQAGAEHRGSSGREATTTDSGNGL